MAETKVSDPIITFKNVSKTYTLYKDDKARFKALSRGMQKRTRRLTMFQW